MKLKNLGLGLLALSLLAIPAAAQNGRSNKSGAKRGDNRVDLVQADSKSKDKDRDPSTDNDKNKGKHNGETKGKHNGVKQGQHKAIGHTH